MSDSLGAVTKGLLKLTRLQSEVLDDELEVIIGILNPAGQHTQFVADPIRVDRVTADEHDSHVAASHPCRQLFPPYVASTKIDAVKSRRVSVSLELT